MLKQNVLNIVFTLILFQTYSDNESITDYSLVQEYMLQCCRTDNRGNDDSVFSTVYCGEESSHLVTDLEPHVSYTFRVCGRYGSEAKWGSWSIPRNGVTTLDQHGEDVLMPEGCIFFSLHITLNFVPSENDFLSRYGVNYTSDSRK